MDFATIAAVATPVGSGGIGIIRISGKEASEIVKAVFQPARPENLDAYQSHRLYRGWILDRKAGRILDEVLMAYMRAPHSYTREDVVEIQAHGGPAALRATLDLVLRHGARLADPGEFTRRAFLNGRIDLTQAEAVIDVVNARTLASLEIAAAQVHGELGKAVEACRAGLFDVQAALTAAIDFPEEAGEALDPGAAVEKLRVRVLSALKILSEQYATGRILREGIRLVVTGPPNVGKSSLMNRLLQRDRAIVSPYPGTTRDFIEENLDLGGFPALIVDTAGLQETEDPVELIGIEKTREKIQEADLLLFMVDATQPSYEALRHGFIPAPEKPTILVINKADRVESVATDPIPEAWRHLSAVWISALYNQGIDALKETIFSTVTRGKGFGLKNPIVPNARHKVALDRAIQATEAAVKGLGSGLPAELICMDIGEALDALGEILGETIRPDVLDAIFSRFCIGK